MDAATPHRTARFAVGDVVASADGPSRPAERGVVVWADGDGLLPPSFCVGAELAPGSYCIRLAAAAHAVGSLASPDADRWGAVPPDEWTAAERVLSAVVSWEPPDDPDGEWGAAGGVPDHLSFPFAVLRALLPPDAAARVFPDDGDWPTGYAELAEHVAAWLDGTLPAQRTLGAALARLGAAGG